MTIQWEPTSENSRNLNSISSKGGLHSIESPIPNEAKIANLTRRLEVLETKEPSPVNQVSPNEFSIPGCNYCQAMNHVFEVCPVFQAQQYFLESINAAFSRPNNDPYAPAYNPSWRNHPNFSWSQHNNDHPQSKHASHSHHSNNSSNYQSNFPNYPQNSPNNFSNYQQNFPNQAPPSSFQNPQLERRMTDFERNMNRYMKNQDSLMQTIQRLEVQMSQSDNPQNERKKGTLSQPIMNPRNSQQAHLAEDQSLNQCNAIHTLRSRKKVDNQCQHHLISFSTITLKHPPHLVLILPSLMNLKQISQPVRYTSLQYYFLIG